MTFRVTLKHETIILLFIKPQTMATQTDGKRYTSANYHQKLFNNLS